MRVQKRSPWLNGLGVVLAAMALWGGQAQAGVSSDKPGSVVLWPKVIADGTRDTLISLTNTRNEQAYAHCEYVQGLGICALSGDFCSVPGATEGPGACEDLPGNVCQAQWQSADFDVVLTRQQPTIWRVSTGRVDNPFLPADGECVDIPPASEADPLRQSCPGLFLVGNVPPAPDQPFRGQLTCIQVAPDGSALGSDGLKGEATIETLGSGQVSVYNSINVEALQGASVDGLIRLDGVEYSACPEAVEVSHYAPEAQDLVAEELDPAACGEGEGCPVDTEITIVPCRADYVNETPARWATLMLPTNEFEQTSSVSATLECWANFDLRDLPFPPATTTFQRTRIQSTGSGRCIVGGVNDLNQVCSDDADCGAGGVCGPVTGLLAIVEEFHNAVTDFTDPPTQYAATAASNGYSVDLNGDGSLERPGHCRNDLTQECTSASDCPEGGLCRYSGAACDSDSECTGEGDFCDICMNDEILFEPASIELPGAR